MWKEDIDKISPEYYISTRYYRVLTIINKQTEVKMAQFKIQPLQDRVIVKPKEAEETTKGGIILPDTAKEKPIEGTVVAVGEGKVTDDGKVVKLTVKVGDTVLYGKYSGTEVKIEGEEYLIMRESDIYGIVK